MRKNLFVDFHRMNLLERYDKKGNLIEIRDKKPVSKVRISPWGKELINSSRMIDKYLIYGKAVNFFLEERIAKLVNIMKENDNYLEIEEFQLFVSFLGLKINDEFFDEQKINDFLNDYRNLPPKWKKHLVEKIESYCNPKKFPGDKKSKRDFGNWKNAAQQFFSLLDTTAYFELTEGKNKLILGKNQSFGKDFEEVIKIIRSNVEKKKYFINHNVNKRLGFELHHINPLFKVKCLAELKLADNWKNMIYIRAYEHSIITQSWRKVSRPMLTSSQEHNDNLYLSNLSNSEESKIEFKNGENLCYDPSKKKLLLEYNEEMLKV
ncbi:MAG: Type-2 restriction enzyme MboII [Mycoplasmataceae bacterium]|nr:MAG: Type-2 restriction enzyme MboII [Mycoplasmataceae bacterium]